MSLGDEKGFTLVELLATISTGMVVLLAIFALVDVSHSNATTVSDRVDATQRGRNAMDQIIRQLRTQTCLGPGYPAITQADDSSLTFYADPSSAAFAPERRQLVYAAGAITEYGYSGAGTLPNLTFASVPDRTRNVASTIAPVSKTPVFRYYAFDTAGRVSPLPLPTPLAAADMARVVKISVAFVVRPTRTGKAGATESHFQDSVFVRTADPLDPARGPQCV